MAFEQCHYPHETYICNYIVLLDHLIKTEKDVDLLVEKKVLDNWLGRDEAVVNLINSAIKLWKVIIPVTTISVNGLMSTIWVIGANS